MSGDFERARFQNPKSSTSTLSWKLHLLNVSSGHDLMQTQIQPPSLLFAVQQNQIHEGKIQRRPSRTTIAKKPERPVQGGLTVPSPAPRPAGTNIGSMLGSTPLSTSLGPSSSYGPQIFLRIRVADTADAVHISTTIPVCALLLLKLFVH
jgi:hypothetical protein